MIKKIVKGLWVFFALMVLAGIAVFASIAYGWIGYIHCILNVLLMYLLSAFMSLKQVNQREGLGSRQIKFRKYGIQSGLIH